MYTIGYVWSEDYDFTNAQGERITGTSRKCLLIRRDGKSGAIIRGTITKCARDFTPEVGDYTSVYFDEYGRLAGCAQ